MFLEKRTERKPTRAGERRQPSDAQRTAIPSLLSRETFGMPGMRRLHRDRVLCQCGFARTARTAEFQGESGQHGAIGKSDAEVNGECQVEPGGLHSQAEPRNEKGTDLTWLPGTAWEPVSSGPCPEDRDNGYLFESPLV